MILKINGQPQDLAGVSNLEELVTAKKLKRDNIVIEYNSNIIPKEQWPQVMLCDNDVIEIVSFVGGG